MAVKKVTIKDHSIFPEALIQTNGQTLATGSSTLFHFDKINTKTQIVVPLAFGVESVASITVAHRVDNVKDEDLTNFSRLITVGMALVALGIAALLYYLYPDRQIFWIMIFGWSGIAATFCPVIILSLFWKGYTEKGAIASMITGFASVIVFKFVFSNMEGIGKYFVELDVLAPSFALAMIVGYIVSKMFPNKGIKDL